MLAKTETKGGDFSVGRVERLFHANGVPQVFTDFDVSPDGKSFLLPGVLNAEATDHRGYRSEVSAEQIAFSGA